MITVKMMKGEGKGKQAAAGGGDGYSQLVNPACVQKHQRGSPCRWSSCAGDPGPHVEDMIAPSRGRLPRKLGDTQLFNPAV